MKGEEKMSLNQPTNDCRITMPLVWRDVNTDISEEMTLADYYPEIRKMLYLRCSLLPPSKFISGNKIDVSGVADYTIVYLSADGQICSAPFLTEYSFSLPVENMNDFEIGEGVTVMAHSVCESSSVRVSSPRRLQIRSHLRTSLGAWGKRLCSEEITNLENCESVERLGATLVSTECFCESSDVITLSDEYKLPNESAGVTVAEGRVSIKDYRIEEECVRMKGDVMVELLICSSEGRSETVTRKLPFDVSTELDGVDISEDCSLRVSGNVTDLSVNVEDGNAQIEANAVLEICCFGTKELEYTADLFSVEQECTCHYRDLEIPKLIYNGNISFAQTDKISVEDMGIFDDAELVDARAYATVEGIERDEAKISLRGTCKYNLVYARNGEYASAEAKLPFRCELDAKNTYWEIISFDAIVDGIGTRAKRDGDYISFDTQMDICATLWGSEKVRTVESADFGEALEKHNSAFIVCYPTSEDDLWSIAKRYSVRQCDVSGEPAQDRFLMIERK